MLLNVLREIAQFLLDAGDRQPELKLKFNQQSDNQHPNASDMPSRINALIVHPETSIPMISNNPISTDDKTLSGTKVLTSSISTVYRKTHRPNPNNPKNPILNVSFDNTVVPDNETSLSPPLQSFPTEQANRQKERKKAGLPVQKRKQVVEQHQDDMGDDLSSIQVNDAEIAAFANERIQEENLTDWEHAIFHFMLDAPFQHDAPPILDVASFDVMLEHVDAFYQSNNRRIHVCELFGGEGHTSKLCSKLFGLTSGVNFELKCGFNLHKQSDKQDLINYLQKYKPDVVVMAPPCKGFGPWSYLNEVIHPEAVQAAKSVGIPLAKLCAQVAEIQLEAGRHFVLEQPRNSTMFDLKEWKQLMPRLHFVICDQCRFGLVERCGMPLKKPTKFVASHVILLEHLRDKLCFERHPHGKVTSEAERWPHKLCKAVATGIADLLCDRHSQFQYMLYLPTFSCPGCRGHVRRDDPRHVRDETCKFKNEQPTEWKCPACLKHRHRSDERHTLGPDCRWAIASTRAEGAGRARRGHHPRDPSVKAASEPTSRLRLPESESLEHPDRVATESTAPEVLTPAQAAARRRAKQSIEVQAGHDPDLVEASDVLPSEGAAASCARPVANASEPAAPASEIVPVEAVAPLPDVPSWSKFDLGTTLQLLRSVRPGVVRRTLRRLHIRWYHAPAKRMATLLSSAGVPASVLQIVPDVVSTCDICRAWSKPSARSVVSTRMPEKFNQELEIDLLFIGPHVVLHLIDRAIRWSVGVKIPSKETQSILAAVKRSWVTQYGRVRAKQFHSAGHEIRADLARKT